MLCDGDGLQIVKTEAGHVGRQVQFSNWKIDLVKMGNKDLFESLTKSSAATETRAVPVQLVQGDVRGRLRDI